MDALKKTDIPLIPNVGNFKNRLQDQVETLVEEIRSFDSSSSREKIHKIRILTRRSRASFSVFFKLHHDPQIKKYLKNLKGLTRMLGPVRSLDVSQKDLKSRLKAGESTETAPLEFVLKDLRKRRKKSRSRLIKEIRRPKLFKKLLDSPFPKLSFEITGAEFLRLLDGADERMVQGLRGKWEAFAKSGKITHLHALRIQLKKWRYLLEIHADCLGIPTKDQLERIKSLQDRLGYIHDTEVLRDYLKVPKLKSRAKKRHAKGPYRDLVEGLTQEVQAGVESFRQEGGDILLPLLERGVA